MVRGDTNGRDVLIATASLSAIVALFVLGTASTQSTESLPRPEASYMGPDSKSHLPAQIFFDYTQVF